MPSLQIDDNNGARLGYRTTSTRTALDDRARARQVLLQKSSSVRLADGFPLRFFHFRLMV